MKATIYESRLESLIAKTSDTRDAYVAVLPVLNNVNGAMAKVEFHGLATSEHQFRLALTHSVFEVRKLTAREIQSAMAEELSQLTKGK